ncbi:DUF1059 domain-containing protein [Flavobacterium frigoris]|uniref:DUF1059 domain-containing protein n=1 Tax=Flavobacterium frigoris TaxID=229204 RepID=A0A1H9RG19_FLAFI|nr:DUF1059 domain-containing protein [Flavobacterium frigoris]SER70899.1 hypothetical protein SAMN05444355_12031 [Flavobacterium frigoris]
MKTMTCKQLGGACEAKFHANTFEEIAELSKNHALEMIEKKDDAHKTALREMQELMHFPEGMNAWYENKRKTFESLPTSEN